MLQITAVAMSGGVDSAVAALLAKEVPGDVISVTARIWTDESADALSTVNEARRVADALGIRHYCIDIADDFYRCIVQNFIDEYLSGRTPNPCTRCNPLIKFGAMADVLLDRLRADYGKPDVSLTLVSGHYARVERHNERWVIRKGVDTAKDQSYMLYRLSQEQLSRLSLPLGTYTKQQVRELADRYNLGVSHKPESQDACFTTLDYRTFIRRHTTWEIPEGNFVDERGAVVGRHKGTPFYTIGQRRGLGIASTEPYYVKEIRTADNTIVLARHSSLDCQHFTVTECNWIATGQLTGPIHTTVKIRYNSPEKKALISPIDTRTVTVEFEQSQQAVTPGQSAVFYDGDIVIGGGTIQ